MQIVLIAWAAMAAVCDWRWRRLPNWLTLGALALGIVWTLLAGSAPLGGALWPHLGAAAIALVALLPAYLAGWLGAGDVKLYAAMGFLGGPDALLPTLLIACIVAGLGALLVVVREGRRKGRRIPFGIGLSAGFIAAVVLR